MFSRRQLPHLAQMFVVLFLASPGVQAENGFDACASMFPDGVIPTALSPTDQDLCKMVGDMPIFAVRFDSERKTPRWTIHSLSPAQSAQITANRGTMKRPSFKPDLAVPSTARAVTKSYVRSGFSRGHMVPAHDMSWDKRAYDATFQFSNVVPQKQAFNAGTWLGAEKAFRTYVKRKNDTLWVLSGTYGAVKTLSPTGPTAPKCYYKIFAAPQKDPQNNRTSYAILALLFAWDDFGKRATWVNAQTTLARIEQRTGIDFFKGLNVNDNVSADFWDVAQPTVPADCT